MNHLIRLQKIQIALSCGVLTGVWTNLYINLQSSCPHFKKCPVHDSESDEIKKFFRNN